MAKKILKSALSGLAFLHKNGVVHGDFQPGNLLISLRQDVKSINENELQQDQSKITEPLQRLDGKPDIWAPRYLVIGESLHKYADLTPNMSVKISDFGAGKNSNTQFS
jgi:serine/threonine protein kinase